MIASTNDLPTKPFHIAICGGGIAGLALAIGLHSRSIPSTLYESAPSFGEVGAGVSFGPNSIRAMGLICPSIRAAYNSIATQNTDPKKRGTWFDFRLGQDWRGGEKKAGEMVYELKTEGGGTEGVGQSSVHRARFLEELVKLVPQENVVFNHRVTDIEDISSEGVRLHFSHGDTATASGAIGCDGVKSRVRHLVLGDNSLAAYPTFTGKYAYRGLIPMQKAVNLLGEDLAQNAQMYLGSHGHVLTMPIESGATMNVVAFRTKPDGKWEDEKWVLPMRHEDLEEDFRDWGKSVRDILSLMERPDVWALFNYPAAERYWRGRVCLVGDAAHASTPHQGAGAGMALEDTFVLADLLAEVDEEEGIESAFKTFDAVRRSRTQKLVATSREAGRLYDFEGKGVGDDLNKLAEDLSGRMKWIWEEDLEEDLRQGRKLMGY